MAPSEIYLRSIRLTKAMIPLSILCSSPSFSFPAYCQSAGRVSNLGPTLEVGWAHGGTYSRSHFCTQRIVLIVVPHGNDVVTTRIEANGVVPCGFLVVGANGPHALDNLGVVRHDKVGSNAGNRTYFEVLGNQNVSVRHLWIRHDVLEEGPSVSDYRAKDIACMSCLSGLDENKTREIGNRCTKVTPLTIGFAGSFESQMHAATKGVTQHPPLAESSRAWPGDVSETAPCSVGVDRDVT